MENGYKRKKQPELVRERILAAAASVAVKRGADILSIGQVAREAGVTKGGLLHHFPTKQILIEALYLNLLDQFESKIYEVMAEDENPRGRFTRAYVTVTVMANDERLSGRTVGAAVLAMGTDPTLCDKWNDWLREQLAKNGEDIHSPTGRLIRFAADGIWLEYCFSKPPEIEARGQIIERLLAMTETI
ncbi:TetR/AcrR family transcriptional regulator [Deltaproteobacteria bacterium OttesenSCG-928-M10]|nr:TetR/AcrR family transcriptional regulator [Deltaproteobacteria bacterium OttesenSCG-928-M10]